MLSPTITIRDGAYSDLAGSSLVMITAGVNEKSQGTSTVGFSYDNSNRRSTLTLSNGVNVTYRYDNDSRVTGISYKFKANPLGDLAYTYDSLGRRTLVSSIGSGPIIPVSCIFLAVTNSLAACLKLCL